MFNPLKFRLQFVGCGSLLLLALLSAYSQTAPNPASTQTPQPSQAPQAAAPGVSVGERIGNAVSAAVKTAFPAIQPLITAIFGNSSKDDTKKTKADAQTSLQNARTAALQKQQPYFDDLKKAATDLGTVRTFLSYCVVADENVVTMRTILSHSSISAEDKNQLQYAWNTAKPNLQALGSGTISTQIDAIGDPFVQTTLKNVANANLGGIQNVDDQLKNADWSNLRISIGDLEVKISGVNALTGIIVGNISSGILSIPDKIKNSEGANVNPEEQKEMNIFRSRLTKLYGQ
jgi:hypothetical protein